MMFIKEITTKKRIINFPAPFIIEAVEVTVDSFMHVVILHNDK